MLLSKFTRSCWLKNYFQLPARSYQIVSDAWEKYNKTMLHLITAAKVPLFRMNQDLLHEKSSALVSHQTLVIWTSLNLDFSIQFKLYCAKMCQFNSRIGWSSTECIQWATSYNSLKEFHYLQGDYEISGGKWWGNKFEISFPQKARRLRKNEDIETVFCTSNNIRKAKKIYLWSVNRIKSKD